METIKLLASTYTGVLSPLVHLNRHRITNALDEMKIDGAKKNTENSSKRNPRQSDSKRCDNILIIFQIPP